MTFRKLTMKIVFSSVWMALCMSSSIYGADTQTRLILCHSMPTDTSFWDHGNSLEAQYVYWKDPYLGLSLSTAAGSWKVNDHVDIMNLAGQGPTRSIRTSGRADLLALGASVVCDPNAGGAMKTQNGIGNVSILFESGVKYVFINSDIETSEAMAGEGEIIYGKKPVDIDDGLIGLVTADIVLPFPHAVKMFLGMGYQFDIFKGGMSWAGYDLGDNRFKSFVFRLSINMDI